MKRVESNGMWSLMCPDRCRNLNDVYGEEFEKLYTEYESKGMYIRQLKAQELWSHILELKLKLELLTCFTKTRVTKSQIKKI